MTGTSLGYGAIGNDMGGAVRALWWCNYCRAEHLEPRGWDIFYPVIDSGRQSKRCDCGRKLRRIG